MAWALAMMDFHRFIAYDHKHAMVRVTCSKL
jgi:hypothetical protein